MKKLGLLSMAMALVMTFSQCKKDETATITNEGEKVFVTLKVNGNGNSKVVVTPETGDVTFENGDVIHVVSNGTCVGTLTYNGTQFGGEITEPMEGQKLQFYFFGNKTPEFNSDNTSCSVVISDQTASLPVISYGPSKEDYQIGKTDYNAILLNKCALVKFDVTTSSTSASCILGMNNKVTVDFTTNEFTYGQYGEGIITLPAGNGERWVILLPQDEVTEAQAQSSNGCYTGTCDSIPTITENDYLTEGIALAITKHVGIIDGAFTINANGDQVYFSQGNLQYIGSAATPYWKFADHQWDYLGKTTGQNSSNENVDRDLFGWGTSGYDHGANCYQPWSTGSSAGDFYAYGEISYNLYDQTGKADWGYNAISNGGNTEGQWRTLTNNEWNYVLYSRPTLSGIRYAKAKVNGVYGVILLPDNWLTSTYALSNTNSSAANYSTNIITAEDWANMFEANGAVFLPQTGYRNGTSVIYLDYGRYWSSSYSRQEASYGLCFNNNSLYMGDVHRALGQSVRLVLHVE